MLLIKSLWCFLPIFLFINRNYSYQEGPKQIKLDDPAMIAVILDYEADCHKNGAFYEDKGVITCSVCKGDKPSEKKYFLALLIDDRYEDHPPFAYTHFRNNVVLFDSCGKSPVVNDKAAYFKVLNEEIGDRVYKRPGNKGRWVQYLNEKKEVVSGMKEVKALFGGNHHNEMVYTVHEDVYKSRLDLTSDNYRTFC